MPVTASNGFPCLKKNMGEHKQMFFLQPTFSIPEKCKVGEICFLTFGNCLLYVGNIGSSFEFDLGCGKIGIFTFGFRVVC